MEKASALTRVSRRSNESHRGFPLAALHFRGAGTVSPHFTSSSPRTVVKTGTLPFLQQQLLFFVSRLVVAAGLCRFCVLQGELLPSRIVRSVVLLLPGRRRSLQLLLRRGVSLMQLIDRGVRRLGRFGRRWLRRLRHGKGSRDHEESRNADGKQFEGARHRFRTTIRRLFLNRIQFSCCA
jgi:hypothetical protein